MFDKLKETVAKDALLNDLKQIYHYIQKANEDVSANLSPSVGALSTKSLDVLRAAEERIGILINRHQNENTTPPEETADGADVTEV